MSQKVRKSSTIKPALPSPYRADYWDGRPLAFGDGFSLPAVGCIQQSGNSPDAFFLKYYLKQCQLQVGHKCRFVS